MNFKLEKNGYNIKEVDRYIENMKGQYETLTQEQKIRISDLKREVDTLNKQLKTYKDKNSNISDALVVAVETAKQIENSSKNIYELEISRIRNLYSKWNSFLQDLMTTYPKLKSKYDSEKLVEEFGKEIDEIIKKNSVSVSKEEGKSSVGIRNLIAKMGGLTASQVQAPVQIRRNNVVETKSEVEEENEIPFEKKSDVQLKIKPIANLDNENSDKFNSLVEKFFANDEEAVNAFSKALIRQKKASGFDLKEALNPTEDLAEIMKGFDFFDDKDND